MVISKKDIGVFVGINLAFALGMIVLILKGVHSWLAWSGYIVLWSYAEMHFSRNIHLKTWHWVMIILGLCAIDLWIITLIK